LAKNNRAFKSAKRNKELARLKKQEEKRRKRLEREQSQSETGAELEPNQETPGQDIPNPE
jgi:hypothetical protein